MKKNEWWTDAFQKGWYPLPTISSDWEKRTRTELQSLQRIMGSKKGLRILDLPCGAGRHSVGLAKLGHFVTGIDVSRQYLAVAEKTARRARVKANFLSRDMRAIEYNNEFDVALNLFSSFGYFKKKSDDEKVVANLFRALVPGGILVLDTINPEFITKHFLAQSFEELSDGTLLLEQRVLPDQKGVLKTKWIFVTPKGVRRKFDSEIRSYSRRDLEKLLTKVGFKSIQFLAPLTLPKGKTAPKMSSRIVVMAKKPPPG